MIPEVCPDHTSGIWSALLDAKIKPLFPTPQQWLALAQATALATEPVVPPGPSWAQVLSALLVTRNGPRKYWLLFTPATQLLVVKQASDQLLPSLPGQPPENGSGDHVAPPLLVEAAPMFWDWPFTNGVCAPVATQ